MEEIIKPTNIDENNIKNDDVENVDENVIEENNVESTTVTAIENNNESDNDKNLKDNKSEEVISLQNKISQLEKQAKRQHRMVGLVSVMMLVATPLLTYATIQTTNQVNRVQSKEAAVKTIATSANKGESLNVSQIAEKAGASTVEIKNESDQNSSAGSGVILTEDGYIVTNNHVVAGSGQFGASSTKVKLKNGQEYEAKLVGTDPRTDLAVLKINAKGLTPAEIGNSDKVVVGENAVAIGNSLGVLGGTVTKGIISAVQREANVGTYKLPLIQTDAPVNPGNSGGGLFNESGQLIGIVTQKLSGTKVEGLGFAIPSNTMQEIVKDIITNGYVKNRASFGISVREINENTFGIGSLKTGVYVVNSTNDGLKRGDRIIQVNGKTINSSTDLLDSINGKKVGDEVDVKLERDNKEIDVKIKLKEASSN